MNAKEFSKSHACDADWVAAMGNREALLLKTGQRGTYSGFPATVRRHYHNGMYEITTAGGHACIDGGEFIPS